MKASRASWTCWSLVSTWVAGPVDFIYMGFRTAFDKVLHQRLLRNKVTIDMEERSCYGLRAGASIACKG